MFIKLSKFLIILALFGVGAYSSFSFFYSNNPAELLGFEVVAEDKLKDKGSDENIELSEEKLVKKTEERKSNESTDTIETIIPSRSINGISSEALDIPKEGKAIVANLHDMTIFTYNNSNLQDQYDIKSQGQMASEWESPVGKYKVDKKSEEKKMARNNVILPNAIKFFDDFYIHGWPYKNNDEVVNNDFDDDFLRLNNMDAEKLYDFAEIGTKISVVKAGNNKTKGVYLDTGLGLPSLSSDAFMVADINSGSVLFEKDSQEVLPIASLSKLMTALVSIDAINQYNTATVSRSAYGTYGAQGGLQPGQKIKTGDLLYPLLLESSNDASEVLAEYYGRDLFLEKMNNRSKSLGLLNTSYGDPSGLSAQNTSTAEDLFRQVQYIDRYKRFILDTTLVPNKKIGNNNWRNISRFIDHAWYYGGKNGYTDEARKTLVALFKVPFNDEERKIAVVLLHSDDTTSDTRKILSYIEDNVEFLPDLVVSE